MTGVCSAITAARAGVKVILVQDRPVLGGNASSEVRLWVLGATSHMGNNNRWSREGGVLDEILVENTFRNKEGNPVLFDMVLMDKVLAEPNITLLLNTVVYKVEKDDDRTIGRLTAINPQNGTEYTLQSVSPTWYYDTNDECGNTGSGKKKSAEYMDRMFKNCVIAPAEVRNQGMAYFDEQEDLKGPEALIKAIETFLRE